MKFVAISDTHCKHRSLRLPKGDVLLHAGDFGTRGSRAEAEEFLTWIAEQPFAHKIFIAGNHDFFFEREKKAVIDRMLPEGVHYLKDEGINIQGLQIWGSPYTPWFHHWAFTKKRGASLARHWKSIPDNCDVLLTHGPVFGILDIANSERHVGDRDLLKRVLEVKPKAHVCGHIHESYGNIKRHGVRFINACLVNELYEIVNKPVVFEVPVTVGQRSAKTE